MTLVPDNSRAAGATVSSVFARTGAVVAATNDYTAAQVGAMGSDGWIVSADTWVYASATTFTIAGSDRTALYTAGTRIRCTNTTVKYFVVVSSAFSTDTTVTVTGGSDYALANAAITATAYSYAANPQGYPGWFTYAPAPTGFTGAVTVNWARFSVVGNACTVIFDWSGTSNTTAMTATLPIAVATPKVFGPSLIRTIAVSGGSQWLVGLQDTTAGSATQTFYPGVTSPVGSLLYQNSGTKGVSGLMTYQF